MRAKHGDQKLGFLTSQFLLWVSLAPQMWKLRLERRKCQELKSVIRVLRRVSVVFVMTHQPKYPSACGIWFLSKVGFTFTKARHP